MYFRMYLETAAKFETFFLQRTFLYSFRYTKNGFVVIKIIAQSVFIVFCYQKYKVLLELILEPISSLNFVLEEPPEALQGCRRWPHSNFKKEVITWPKISYVWQKFKKETKTRISFRFFSCFVEAIKARWGKNLSSCFFLPYQMWLAKKLEELVVNLWCFHWKQSLRRIQMMSV